MKNTSIKKERDQALYAEFKRVLSDRPSNILRERELIRYVCRRHAPRFYMEPERASKLIGRILMDVSLIDLNDCTRRQTWELYRRYTAYLERHPDNKYSRIQIMGLIVEEPAPEFYIETQRARKIIYMERKKRLQKWGTNTRA